MRRHRLGDARLTSRARHELALVLRREIALLLAQAALLHARRAPFGLFLPAAAVPAAGAGDWRALVRASRSLVEHLGLTELFRLLAEGPASAWPRASELARSALSLAPDAPRGLTLAQVLFAEGATRASRALFLGLCHAELPDDLRWRALAGLAATYESDGNDLLALGALAGAAAVPGCGGTALVDGLFLALVLGELEYAQRAGERLDRLLVPGDAALEDALQRLSERVGFLRGPVALSAAGRPLAERLAHAERGAGAALPPSARVARFALGEEP